MTTSPLPPVAAFVARRIYELEGRKTQLEIAREAGFASPNQLSMIKAGTTKLPIERVWPLAVAMECDPPALLRLAMTQYVTPDLLAAAFIDHKAVAVALKVELVSMREEIGALKVVAQELPVRIKKVDDFFELVRRELDSL